MIQVVYDFLKELEERINGVFYISLRTGDYYLEIKVSWKEGCHTLQRIDIVDFTYANMEDKDWMDRLVYLFNNQYKQYLLKGEHDDT